MSEYQMSIFDIGKPERYVREIEYQETKQFLLHIHYARRMPCICYSFGLFLDSKLIGVVTYGIPPSESLCRGLAGDENKYNVMELNRLCLLPKFNGGGHNHASYLVSHSLKMLPNHTFVVSYADTAWTHVGYIYQATNFLYTGMSAYRTDKYKADGTHSRHYDKDDHSGMRQTRSAKHRYVYLVGDKRTKKQMRKELRYKVYDKYPKGDEIHYDVENPEAVEKMVVYQKED